MKRRHEELERQYQLSIKLKEQENCLKFEQSQLELQQLTESNKKITLIEMEKKSFELKVNLSEVSENVEESNLTRVRQPISKFATDRNNAWVDPVNPQAAPDSASAQGLLGFIFIINVSGPKLLPVFSIAVKYE